jgi:hypothetical protein
MQFHHHTQPADDLDPRRRARGRAARRDWQSVSAVVTIPRLRDLLASALVRAGIIR